MLCCLRFPFRLIKACLITAMGGSLLAWAEPALEERGFPDIRAFTPRDYQGHNQIWTAQQGPDGIMYFGAKAEVITFDGIAWRKIPVPGSAFLRAMDIDAAGTVWVAGVDELGKLEPGADGRLEFVSLRPELPDGVTELGDIRRIFVMPDGVYFQGDAYLLRWQNAQFDVWPMFEPYVTLAIKWGNRLVVSGTNGWRIPTEPGEWEPFPGNQDVHAFTLATEILPAKQGGWWITATRHGLLHADGKSIESVTGVVADYLKQNRLYGATALPDGRLLLFTLGSGLIVTDPELNPLVNLGTDEGLPSGTVICATSTGNGVVWLGTEQGIVRLDFSAGITSFSDVNGLDPGGAEIVERINGRAFLATTTGAVSLTPGPDALSNPVFQPGFEIDDRLSVFYPLEDGSTLAGGLMRMWRIAPGGEVTSLHSPSNIGQTLVHPSFPDHVFSLHLTGIALWRRDGTKWTNHRSLAAPRGEFQSLVVDDAGDLWLGSATGSVWRLPYSEIEPGTNLWDSPDPAPIAYGSSHGLPPRGERMRIRCIDGDPLFMTPYGFFRYDRAGDRFEPEPRYGANFVNGTWSDRKSVV